MRKSRRIRKKLKYKKALNRCLGLYKYGKELQKNLEMNKEKINKFF